MLVIDEPRGASDGGSLCRREASPSGLDGLILIDKPGGPTSHDTVAIVRRTLDIARCGHGGTLDPFATGLLLIAVGRATRLLRFLSGAEKTYEGLIRLGWSTDTDDRTGRPVGEVRPVRFSEEDLVRAVAALEGETQQLPPDYSARKHEGVPHYRLARKGRKVPRRAARILARWQRCERVENDLLRIHLTVSAGTYIRALARDLGELLGCGGHLDELRRLGSGPFRIEEAVALDMGPAELRAAVRPLESIPLGLPTLPLDDDAARRIATGSSVPLPAAACLPELLPSMAGPTQTCWVRLVDPRGRLLAVAELCSRQDPSDLSPQPSPLPSPAGASPRAAFGTGAAPLVLRPRIVLGPLC